MELFPCDSTTESSAVTLLIHLVVLESEAHTRGGEAAALCS